MDITTQVAIYLALIFLYWFSFNKLSSVVQSKIKNQNISSGIHLTLAFLAIGLTIITLILAFKDNVSVFFSSISLLSAALVFTLQDFVSCFFAWVYVRATKQYRVNDLIQIHTQDSIISGWIKEIDLFRTQLRERVGGEGLESERPTGRIVTFPNNFIFKHSLSNETKNHLILWHTLDVVITFESDHTLAKQVLQQSLDNKFEELLKHPDRYFQNGIGELRNFKPKIYNTINANGVAFSVWFGARAGHYRDILEQYSLATLQVFKENGIQLAYHTNRLIHSEDKKI